MWTLIASGEVKRHYFLQFSDRTGPRCLTGMGIRFTAFEEDAAERSPAPAGAPRPSIEELLSKGEEILVQVVKDPIGDKGARLSANITIPGRLLILVALVAASFWLRLRDRVLPWFVAYNLSQLLYFLASTGDAPATVGDADLVAQVKRMRSHPGVASPDFVTAAAVAAWTSAVVALCHVAVTWPCLCGEVALATSPVRISLPLMTSGISGHSCSMAASRALTSARSGEPGAYDLIGSLTAVGIRRTPV